jgi:hypothetical protein
VYCKVVNKFTTYLRHRKFVKEVRDLKFRPNVPHFFIISAGRSGSTLLRRALQNHEFIHIPPESEDFIPKVVEFSLKKNKKEFFDLTYEYLESREWFDYWKIDIGSLINQSSGIEIIDKLYLTHAKINKPDAILIGDKTPLLNNYLDIVYILYPNTKIIYLVRDFRAVVNSYVQSRNYCLESAIQRCKTSIYIYNKYHSNYGSNLITVRYEDLINETETTLKEICLLLDIEFSDGMLEINEINLGDTHLIHHANVHKPSKKTIWKSGNQS